LENKDNKASFIDYHLNPYYNRHHTIKCADEVKTFAYDLSRGNLNCNLPPCENEITAPLKSLHASLKHLTWQTQQIAKGDYSQRAAFMGDFSEAFNTMVEQLSERQKKLEKIAYCDNSKHLYNRNFGMSALNNWLANKKNFVLIFADLDNLKRINDEYGHDEGDIYIQKAASHLKTFSAQAVVCRIGGDEFMLLVPDISRDDAYTIMTRIYHNLYNDVYLNNKSFSYSLSFGIVSVTCDNNMSAGEILRIADTRMYENKRIKKERLAQVA